MREGDDHAVAAADEALELVLRLRQPSGRDCGALSLEGEGLARGQRLQLGRTGEGEIASFQLLPPDALHLAGLPDEVGDAGEWRDEVVRERRRRVVVQGRLDQVEPSLGGRIDRRRLHGPERALRERREGADALDLVPEELDAQRLAAGRGKDVDEPATHGELAALLHALDPFVAGEGEPLGERLEAGLVPDRQRRVSGRAFGGGRPSASAPAETHTRTPLRGLRAPGRAPPRGAGAAQGGIPS